MVQEEGKGPGIWAPALGGSGKAHPVVPHVVDRVVGPEEDVPEDPQGLAILGGQVGGLHTQVAVAIGLRDRRQVGLFIHSFIHSLTPVRASWSPQSQGRIGQEENVWISECGPGNVRSPSPPVLFRGAEKHHFGFQPSFHLHWLWVRSFTSLNLYLFICEAEVNVPSPNVSVVISRCAVWKSVQARGCPQQASLPASLEFGGGLLLFCLVLFFSHTR